MFIFLIVIKINQISPNFHHSLLLFCPRIHKLDIRAELQFCVGYTGCSNDIWKEDTIVVEIKRMLLQNGTPSNYFFILKLLVTYRMFNKSVSCRPLYCYYSLGIVIVFYFWFAKNFSSIAHNISEIH